jgi:hypothetical protein
VKGFVPRRVVRGDDDVTHSGARLRHRCHDFIANGRQLLAYARTPVEKAAEARWRRASSPPLLAKLARRDTGPAPEGAGESALFGETHV